VSHNSREREQTKYATQTHTLDALATAKNAILLRRAGFGLQTDARRLHQGCKTFSNHTVEPYQVARFDQLSLGAAHTRRKSLSR
jgi:hypothetical protein